MLRKLPLAMAIALAVMPIQSQALGLGKIQSKSVLNQPFDAEIQLLSVAQGELDGVKVELASSDAFRRAEIERPFLLSKLKFKTVRKANGDAVIQVYSRQPIQEPYLNFLLEVNWPKGKMVREYTVLLDPPLTTGRKATAVSTPTTSAPGMSSRVTPQAKAMERMPEIASDGEYGPVQANETLWSIADRFRPSGVSTQQMMIAMLEANPQAFSANNINTLKMGTILRIPEKDDIRISHQDAVRLSNEQYQDWKRGMTQPQPAKEAEPAPAEESEQAQPASSDAADVDESARLKLSGSEAASQMGSGEDTDIDTIKQELLTAQEKAVSSESEAEELRSVMADLEKQLVDMKRLIELKDEQLTKLQAANDSTMESATEDSMPAEEVITVETTEIEQAEEAVTETIEEQPVAEPSEPVPVAQAPAQQPEPMPEAPKKEESILDMVTGSATMMGIAVAVLVVLLALIWSAFSRRKESDDDQAVAAAEPVAEATGVDTDTQPVADEHPDEETSFLSEFTPSDLDSLKDDETGEVDPISEADVYIAYGRFDQAEELVKQALENEPGKLSYQHKLLEIYYANKDQEKFTDLAVQMHENGAESEDPDGWNRAKLMGVDLDPENALFADAMDVPSVDVGDDLDMALNELESQLKGDMDNSLADLDDSSEQLEDIDLKQIAGLDESDSVSLDLDGLDSITTESVHDEIMPLPDVGLDASASTVEDEDSAIEELAAELESFNLDGLDASDASIQTPAGEDLSGTDDVLLPGEESLEDLSAELNEVDDVTTKIDLARAYIEMGDKEGARGILDEVIEEGSDAQKQEAQTLIADMG